MIPQSDASFASFKWMGANQYLTLDSGFDFYAIKKQQHDRIIDALLELILQKADC